MTIRRRVSINEVKPPKKNNCLSTPTVYHAAIVIFLEYFAFGLLTTPMITVLDETFPNQTFLMNGIIQGVKGFLSFLSAPLLGALSDGIGRKPFLLLTVTFTCCPIPLMKISHWWYFTMISISGIFSVTFSVVLAYVADITSEENRSWGYGLVSATFAASLVTSPAIGAYLGQVLGDRFVIALATAVAFLDIFFIMAFVPESLPDKVRVSSICSSSSRSSSPNSSSSSNKHTSNAAKISWNMIDPFAALRKVTNDHLVLIICITTFFSYLPEAGQYSCFIVYLRLVMGFSEENVALFIAFGGILSCISQTLVLSLLNQHMGAKRAIIVGLIMEAIQLTLYGFSSQPLLLWFAGLFAAVGSVTYPALSAFVSTHAAADQQGVAQGMVAGIRGLCGGLGPALFGLIFYVFRVDLHKVDGDALLTSKTLPDPHEPLRELQERFLPGPPFAFGAVLVLIAILVSCLIPENPHASEDAAYGLVPSGGGAEPIDGGEHCVGRLRRHPESSYIDLEGNRLPLGDSTLCEDKLSLLSHSDSCPKMHRSSSQNAVNDPGIFSLLLHGWRDSRRQPRLFRKAPTVSFTKARFVAPFRRLLGGFSGPTGERPASPCASPPESHCDYPGQRYSTVMLRHYAEDSEAEAADLSNYRSHSWRTLLHPNSECASPQPQPLAFDDRRFGDNALSALQQTITANRFDGGAVNRAFTSRDQALDGGPCEGHRLYPGSFAGLSAWSSHTKQEVASNPGAAGADDVGHTHNPAVVVQNVSV